MTSAAGQAPGRPDRVPAHEAPRAGRCNHVRWSRRAVSGALAPAVALGTALLLGAGPVRAAVHTVAISNFAFAPPTITVNVGDSVTWTNADTEQHTVTPDKPGAFKGSALIGTGSSYTVTFSTAGTFAYHCEVHPFMTGTVVVRGATKTAAPTPSPRSSARPTPRTTPGQTPSARPTRSPGPTARPSQIPVPPSPATPTPESSSPAPSTAVPAATASPAAPATGVVGAVTGQSGTPGSGGGDFLPLAAGAIVVLAVLAGGTRYLRRSR
jgi:plastocyanin